MKRLILLSISMIMVFCSCENKKSYRPSHFPTGQNIANYIFAIPYQGENNAIKVRVRLNGGPEFDGIWDSGCTLPLKISMMEAAQLVKQGTLSDADFYTKMPISVANGQVATYAAYILKSISFTDESGEVHTLTNVPAVIDDNMSTDILIGLPIMQELGASYEVSQYEQLIYFK